MSECLLTIDPGLTGCGWAKFDVASRELTFSSVIRSAKADDKDWIARCQYVADELSKVVNLNADLHVVIEMPELWEGDVRSYASTSSGSLFKLAVLCGFLGRTFQGSRITFVSPQQWKGQLPKDVVMRRVLKKTGLKKVRDHECDAIGLGLWVLETQG